MPSPEYAPHPAMWQEIHARMSAEPPLPLASIRDLIDTLCRYTTEAEGVTFRTVRSEGLAGIWALPPNALEDAAILFFHGGGYFAGSSTGWRKLVAHLAKASGVAAVAPDYRLAPEHRYPAQLEDAQAAFDRLVADGFSPERIVLAGDSAGGALATALALKLRDDDAPRPAAVVAMSPFYDLLCEAASFETNATHDVAMTREGMPGAVALFLGDTERASSDPYANPLLADPSGLPPMYLTAGGYETLSGGAELFAERARDKDVEVTLDVVPEMQHVFQVMAGTAPEADESIRKIGHFIRSHL